VLVLVVDDVVVSLVIGSGSWRRSFLVTAIATTMFPAGLMIE